jgi:hypothetical protein
VEWHGIRNMTSISLSRLSSYTYFITTVVPLWCMTPKYIAGNKLNTIKIRTKYFAFFKLYLCFLCCFSNGSSLMVLEVSEECWFSGTQVAPSTLPVSMHYCGIYFQSLCRKPRIKKKKLRKKSDSVHAKSCSSSESLVSSDSSITPITPQSTSTMHVIIYM